ncbi:Twitchin [Eumeta japonica]|uniref:Twitchin n=1 Tax=Eumeta variegata TaxID=151549 RepID=A0A4C1T656_EUMVA|nr:Twitchin [Eumeta japonica]
MILLDSPGKPQIVDWSSNHADLKWRVPDDDGGAPITGYVVEKKDNNTGKWVKVLETNTPEPKARVNDLIEGEPPATKTWFHNKARLEGDEVTIDLEPYRTKLAVPIAKRSHTGKYTLKLKMILVTMKHHL